MTFHIIDGDGEVEREESRRAHLARLTAEHETTAERIDVALDGGALLVEAVRSPSLFGGTRVIDVLSLDAVSADNLAAIVEGTCQSSTICVASVDGKLSANLRKALAGVATFERHDKLKGQAVTRRVREMAESRALRPEPAALTLLSERYGQAPTRVRDVLDQMVACSIPAPTARQVATLLGEASGGVAPWEVVDLLEAGDLSAALECLDRGGWADGRTEPFALASHLRSRLQSLGVAVDCDSRRGSDTVGAVVARTGLRQPQAERLVRTAQRLGPQGLQAAWAAFGDLELRLRSQQRSTALERFCTEVAHLFQPVQGAVSTEGVGAGRH